MEKFSSILCAGFCTLLFGGMASHSQHVNANLLVVRNLLSSRSTASALYTDASRITEDARKAEETLLSERKES